MPRLKSLPPRLTSMPSRLGRAPGDEKARLAEREKVIPWRKWYHSQRWKDLRIDILKRDNWTCQKTGVICTGKHPEPNSPVADHKIKHNGDPDLFWDPENIEIVSKAYHDSEKQKQERAQRSW